MPTDVLLSKTDRLEICKSAAKWMMRRCHQYSFDELVNEGYIHITSNDPKAAYWQARMYMFQLIKRGGIGTRVETGWKSAGAKYDMPGSDKRPPRVLDTLTLDTLIDIRDAINKLTPEEQQLIKERFVTDMTFEQIAPLHDKKHSTSIKFQIDKILVKLKIMLGR